MSVFSELKPLHYRAILCDPPWRFTLRSAKGEDKSPQAHYRCMPLNELSAMPVGQLAAPDAIMVMWATFPMLREAIQLMASWGFTYKTGGSWAKQSSTGKKWAFGTGYILRSAAEPYLFGTIGSPSYNSASVRNLIVAPVREHSRKPDDMHPMIEQLVEGPYLELFSRTDRPGWTSWGDEVGKFTATFPAVSPA